MAQVRGRNKYPLLTGCSHANRSRAIKQHLGGGCLIGRIRNIMKSLYGQSSLDFCVHIKYTFGGPSQSQPSNFPLQADPDIIEPRQKVVAQRELRFVLECFKDESFSGAPLIFPVNVTRGQDLFAKVSNIF